MELRPPEEVLRADSLDTLIAAPLTIGHQAMTNPDNVSQHMVGSVMSAAPLVNNEELVDGEVVVYRSDAISGVKARKLKELSPGYQCRIDNTPGIWEGKPYDRVQRDIRYNHIALLPSGSGRQGAEVALRMDSNTALADEFFRETEQPGEGKEKPMELETVRITLDGIDYELQVPKALAAPFRASVEKRLSERNDAADKLSKVEGALAASQKTVEELSKKADQLNDPSFIQARVDERLAVIERARILTPELDCSGKTLDQIRLDALKGAGVPESEVTGKPAAFIEGMFAGLQTVKAAPAAPGVLPTPAVRTDKKDEKPVDADAARERMLQRNRDAWKGSEGEEK